MQIDQFESINRIIAALDRLQNNISLQEVRDRVKNIVEQTFKEPGVLCSFSTKGQFVLSLASDSPDAAYYALAYFKGATLPSPDSSAIIGYASALVFEKTEQGSDAAERDSISELKRKLDHRSHEYLARFEATQGEMLKSIADFNAKQEAQLKANASNLESLMVSIVDARDRQSDALAALTALYESTMQLDAPAKYWKVKAGRHNQRSFWYGASSIIFGCIGAASLGALWVFWINAPILQAAKEYSRGGIEHFPWQAIGFFMLASSLYAWVLRILVKLLMSNIHLASDAEERRTMIITYLALMKGRRGESYARVEDAAALLASIFRPSATGVVNDMGGPANAMDTIGSLVRSGKAGS